SLLGTLIGTSKHGRSTLIKQAAALSIIKDGWKYIEPNAGPANTNPLLTNIETGNALLPQLYNLNDDVAEKNNLAARYPQKVKELAALLQKLKQQP
ncbi:MAG TPA: arylsulfatase, partial [Chitinophagaceae bacterium]|nr:arylsulfatase [Chitinophagaceae bacterium]